MPYVLSRKQTRSDDGKESTYSSLTTTVDFMQPMYNPWLPRRPSRISINPANGQLQGVKEES